MAGENKKIVVIGDVMLDKYNYCSNRENPESSAPCYTVERTEHKPGGAGNVAANLASLGADFELISVVGNDSSSRILEEVLRTFKVPCKFIFDEKRQTIVKERLISVHDNRYHCRIDREKREYIDENHVAEILQRINGAGLILISDYRKGVISEQLMRALKERDIPIIADPKPEHIGFYHNVFLLKPNSKEVKQMTGIEDEILAGELLMKKLNVNVLLTMGSKGISYFGLNGTRYSFSAEERKVVDVTGAGDTAIATFCHYFVKGRSLEECVRVSNKAAGIAVSYPGCYHIKEEEILAIRN